MTKIMGTKADTLKYLSEKVSKSSIEKMYIITCSEYMADKEKSVDKINKFFNGRHIVIRSSSSNEDGERSSNAGHYDSILDINPDDKKAVMAAVDTVVKSYERDIEDVSGEQVLIQGMLTDITYSGVVFSRELKCNRPYYTITYDCQSTDAVTSGRAGKTVYISRNADIVRLPAHWGRLIDAVKELEAIYTDIPLDIEFAIDKENNITIFQVRPLAACINRKENDVSDREIFDAIEKTERDYIELNGLLKDRNTILSDMAFWNPAEIIGENPHPLDYSLYRDIITKSAWNQGLNYIGYRAVDGDLMYKLGNKPYISLKQSFLCLMPEDMDRALEDKLLKYYNEKLLEDISAHDKIEFEIVFSSYDFQTEDRLKELEAYGFSKAEIDDLGGMLFNLTNNAICNFKRNRMKDIRALNGLKVHRENIRSNWLMSMNDVNTLLQYVTELLESIKHYGTPKFARQARLAFISKAFCRSLVARGYFTDKEIDDFMMSIYTVAAEYDSDFQDLMEGKITRVSFDEKYGHLRSGTYDITCDTYTKMRFDTAKGSETARKQRQKIESLRHNPLDAVKLADALDEIGFFIGVKDFMDFLKTSMEEREYFKFEFTKALSLAIDILIEAGEKLGIDKNELAYLDIDDVRMCTNKNPEIIKDRWLSVIEKNKKQYKINSMLILPDVISDSLQISCIDIKEARPNFITSECVTGEVVVLENYDKDDTRAVEAVHDRIVVLTKADPGYDWIFAHGIRGFVTKYGGVASHMAIRCAEFNIPAAIGCGDVIYNEAAGMKRMTLDCKNGKIIKEG
ncbi:MAG: PEP-utilizing enzyme [Coprococcus sp.]